MDVEVPVDRMPVEQYCERTSAALFAEPLNAASNAAFLVAAAALAWLLLRHRPAGGRAPASLWLLVALVAAVGLGSLAFHTVADGVTALLDVGAIVVFALTAVVVTTRWLWGVPWRHSWPGAAGLAGVLGLGAAVGTSTGVDPALVCYLCVLAALVVLGLLVRHRAPGGTRSGRWLLVAAVVFAGSLAARMLDRPLCDVVPSGTHFLWHLLNAAVLFLVSYPAVARWRDHGSPPHPPR